MAAGRVAAACSAGHGVRSLAGQRRAASSSANSMYFGCGVYVSEARDAAVLRQLESVAGGATGARLANLFVDEPYNRTNFTLVGSSVPQLAAAVASLAKAALELLDLRQHAATHPRLGTVDHISCHSLSPPNLAVGAAAAAAQSGGCVTAGKSPVAGAGLEGQQWRQQQQGATAALAQAIAQLMGTGPQAVPVFTYGWAHPQQRPLDSIRRELGYFQGSAGGSWQGSLQLEQQPAGSEGGSSGAGLALALPLAPCYGPAAASVRSGVCCVGAAQWIVNYNVLLHSDDMAAARGIARAVSERGGGLPAVQAMALRHTDGIEVACNLLDTDATSAEAVLLAVRQLAAQRGVAVGPAYRTNKAPEDLVAAALAQGL